MKTTWTIKRCGESDSPVKHISQTSSAESTTSENSAYECRIKTELLRYLLIAQYSDLQLACFLISKNDTNKDSPYAYSPTLLGVQPQSLNSVTRIYNLRMFIRTSTCAPVSLKHDGRFVVGPATAAGLDLACTSVVSSGPLQGPIP